MKSCNVDVAICFTSATPVREWDSLSARVAEDAARTLSGSCRADRFALGRNVEGFEVLANSARGEPIMNAGPNARERDEHQRVAEARGLRGRTGLCKGIQHRAARMAPGAQVVLTRRKCAARQSITEETDQGRSQPDAHQAENEIENKHGGGAHAGTDHVRA